MAIVLVSDIFGRTPAFETLAKSLTDITGSQTVLFDPYQGESLDFTDEQAAYHYFSLHIDVENYANMLVQYLLALHQESSSNSMVIVGFSAGATAAWLLACKQIDNQTKGEKLPKIAQVIGVYGSQIRNKLQ